MVTVAEAERLVLEAADRNAASHTDRPETVPLASARGRVLAEDVFADRDQPPFHRVAMDGIAVSSRALHAGRQAFQVQGIAPAGQEPPVLADDTFCVEVMTGAVLPPGTDTVIRIEDVAVSDGAARVKTGAAVSAGQNVHVRGSDARAGSVVLPKGVVLRAPELAMLGAVGCSRVPVTPRPVASVVSTGDELVDITAVPSRCQVRASNLAGVRAALEQADVTVARAERVPDQPDRLRECMVSLLEETRLVVLTGGVSKGRYDYVPDVLHSLGVVMVLHGVAQRPGKPLWFGAAPNGTAVFGLPGNPVSAIICAYRYVLPYLQRYEARVDRRRPMVPMGAAVTLKPPLTLFMPANLECGPDGTWCAMPRPTNGSGDFFSLAGTDGFVELAPDGPEFAEGRPAPLFRWS